ncbi:MAG TPA: phosphatase PAP2 family protein, partial [Acidimicrobiia bacterium]|nr:phosphatase PAP2 family protein [Acidimicrobiia bacterium]
MTWIRKSTEPAERRTIDIVRLVFCTIGVVLSGVWAQSQSSVDVNLFHVVNGLGDNMVGIGKAVYALGSIWAVLAIFVVLFALRQVPVALRVGIAGAAAWGIAELLNDLLGTQSKLGVNVRIGDGPTFPTANVAAITAVAVALSPFAVRALRRLFFLFVVLVSFAAMYLGAGFPSDVAGGILLGLTTAAAVLVAFGSPAGKPSTDEVRDALTDLGYDVADLRFANERISRASVMDVTLASGDVYRADVFGRDQRDAQVVAKLWHSLMYKEPGLPVFGSRVQQVEHIAYTLLLADRAGVHAPHVVKTGVGGADAAVLLTTIPPGTPLADLEGDQVTDAALAELWAEVDRLHCAGISHGDIDASRILVTDGQVAFEDFSSADAMGQQAWIDRDVAAVLVATAIRVGNERAIAAAVGALGKERVGSVIPLVQPAALPAGTTKGTKHLGKLLKELRNDLATATGADDAKPTPIRRLTWGNVGMLVGVLLALALAIYGLEGV